MKKILALLLVFLMTISMVACGKETTSAEENKPSQATTDTQAGKIIIPIEIDSTTEYKIVVEEVIITESVAWEKPQYIIEAKVRNLTEEVCDEVSIQSYLYDDEDTNVSAYYFSVHDLAPGKAAKVEIYTIDAYNNTDVDVSKGFSVSFNNYTILDKVGDSTYSPVFSEDYAPFLNAQYPTNGSED